MRVILCLLMFCFVGCAPTLAGKLTLSSGDPIISKSGSVNITSLNSKTQKPVVINVDENGEWSTDLELSNGDYLVEALVPGYSLGSKKISLGKGEDVTIVLSKLGSVNAKAIGVNVHSDVGRGFGGATLTPPKL
jgi:hypothetical protein